MLLALLAAQMAPPLGKDLAVEGTRTEVATLGSLHLSGLTALDRPMLQPLLDRLAAFRPSLITIESVSGEQCDQFRANPRHYEGAFDQWCWDAEPVRASAGLTREAAEAEIDGILAKPSPERPAEERRRLILLFLAAGDRASAYVQYLRLPAAERRPEGKLTADDLASINRTGKPLNENYDLAATLAARLGLERVYPVDDHSSDGVLAAEGKPFEDDRRAAHAAFAALPFAKRDAEARAGLASGSALLEWYRVHNRPHGIDQAIQADMGAAARTEYGRHYLGWWEVRNLRMVSNVRASFAARPGARVLNIVGSAHKPWYDSLLSMMADVRVVPVETYLDASPKAPGEPISGR